MNKELSQKLEMKLVDDLLKSNFLLLLKKLGQEKLFYISCCKGIRDPNTE
jgi:hypothetical protein